MIRCYRALMHATYIIEQIGTKQELKDFNEDLTKIFKGQKTDSELWSDAIEWLINMPEISAKDTGNR